MIDPERLAQIKSMTNNDIAIAIEGHNAPADQIDVQTTVTIPFYGDSIVALLVDGEYMVPVKPIAERFGLAWHGQFERMKRDFVLNKGIRVTRIPSAGACHSSV